MRKIRLSATLALLLSIIFLPYWFYLPLLLAAMIVLPLFFEAILLGFLIDILYGRGISALSGGISPLALSATLILIALMPIRDRLRAAR